MGVLGGWAFSQKRGSPVHKRVCGNSALEGKARRVWAAAANRCTEVHTYTASTQSRNYLKRFEGPALKPRPEYGVDYLMCHICSAAGAQNATSRVYAWHAQPDRGTSLIKKTHPLQSLLKLYSLQLAPFTLHPSPYTLHHTPYTPLSKLLP